MKKILILLTLIFFVPFAVNAVELKIDKQTSWGGNGNNSFKKMVQTSDGGFILYGASDSTDIEGLSNKGYYDAIIVKYDKDWNMQWQKSLGGRKYDEFIYVFETQEGEFIVFGYFPTGIEGLLNKGGLDAIIVKYDKDGNLLWQKSLGGNDRDLFFEVLQTSDGGFIASGASSSTDIEGLPNKGGIDVIIVKYDKDGNMLWQTSWGGNAADNFQDMLQTQDGGFMIYGSSSSTDIEGLSNKGENDVIIVKYSIEYELVENTISENGTSTVEQQGKYGIITPAPNKGYEVDKIIIKDKEGNTLDVETTKLEDGTYSFPLFTDVSIEVLFKKELVNPKTGLINTLLVLVIGFAVSFTGFILVKKYNEQYEI